MIVSDAVFVTEMDKLIKSVECVGLVFLCGVWLKLVFGK